MVISKWQICIFFLWPFLLWTQLSYGAHNSCAYIKSKTVGVTDPTEKDRGHVLDRGLIFPVVNDEDKGFIEILFAEKSLFVKAKKVRVVGAKYCSLKPQCVSLNKNSHLYRKPTQQKRTENLFKVGTRFPYVASKVKSTKGRKVLWHQVRKDQDHFWVPAAFVNKEDQACKPESSPVDRKWFLMTDYSYGLNLSTQAYDSVLTSVPNPSQVTCLQNPIFQSFDKGNLNSFNISAFYRALPYLSLRMGVSYERRSYQLNSLQNPHPDPGETSCELIDTELSSLSAGRQRLEEVNISVPLGLFYNWHIKGNHHFLIGGNYVSIFNIQSPSTLTYFTGDTLSKMTQNSIDVPINQLRDTYNLELRYIYNWPLNQDQIIGLSVLFQQHPDFSQFGIGVVL